MRGIFGERFRARIYRRNGMSCEDCGGGGRLAVTQVYFWGARRAYWFCSECIRPYRTQIMHPDPEWERGRAARLAAVSE